MRKVFFDTNVLLDAAIPSRENFAFANSALSACDYNDIQGCVSVLTVANAAYILKKGRTVEEMITVLRANLVGLHVLPMNNEQLQQAYCVDAPDFEDVLQYECAKAAGCDLIITGNTKHFKFCKDIEVVSTIDYAQQFVEEDDDDGVS